MIHPDGLEVYLKPTGDKNEGFRHSEFPIQIANGTSVTDNSHIMRTMILAKNEDFVVVLRCTSSFRMTGASVLRVAIYDGYTACADETMLPVKVVQRSLAHGQHRWKHQGFLKRVAHRVVRRSIPYFMASQLKGMMRVCECYT